MSEVDPLGLPGQCFEFGSRRALRVVKRFSGIPAANVRSIGRRFASRVKQAVPLLIEFFNMDWLLSAGSAEDFPLVVSV
jgi:hypothetical protein